MTQTRLITGSIVVAVAVDRDKPTLCQSQCRFLYDSDDRHSDDYGRPKCMLFNKELRVSSWMDYNRCGQCRRDFK